MSSNGFCMPLYNATIILYNDKIDQTCSIYNSLSYVDKDSFINSMKVIRRMNEETISFFKVYILDAFFRKREPTIKIGDLTNFIREIHEIRDNLINTKSHGRIALAHEAVMGNKYYHICAKEYDNYDDMKNYIVDGINKIIADIAK